tara:strand:- start:7682 stop:7924 length:243 start_codon:yes stop_codon:yes gene_type:complete
MKDKKYKNKWTFKRNIRINYNNKNRNVLVSDHLKNKKSTLKKINNMSPLEKKILLQENGIISYNSNLPNSLIDTILNTMV